MPVRTLSRVLTQAIVRLEDDLLLSTDPEDARRTASALATLAGVYANVQKTAGTEEQVEAIRAELEQVRQEMHADRANPRGPSIPGASAPTPDVN